MRLFSKPSSKLKLISILVPFWVMAPVGAHEIETSGNVAAMFHIEPNHNPKVGVPSRAWFALTRRGGQIIPLSQCNCQLAVYSLPQKNKTPLLKPSLSSLNIERYRGVPSATITFPQAGRYQLTLTGTPKAGGYFQPFSLSYQVTVVR
jgi:hypothetical protein